MLLTCPFELLKNIFARSQAFGGSFGVKTGLSSFLFENNWIARGSRKPSVLQ